MDTYDILNALLGMGSYDDPYGDMGFEESVRQSQPSETLMQGVNRRMRGQGMEAAAPQMPSQAPMSWRGELPGAYAAADQASMQQSPAGYTNALSRWARDRQSNPVVQRYERAAAGSSPIPVGEMWGRPTTRTAELLNLKRQQMEMADQMQRERLGAWERVSAGQDAARMAGSPMRGAGGMRGPGRQGAPGVRGDWLSLDPAQQIDIENRIKALFPGRGDALDYIDTAKDYLGYHNAMAPGQPVEKTIGPWAKGITGAEDKRARAETDTRKGQERQNMALYRSLTGGMNRISPDELMAARSLLKQRNPTITDDEVLSFLRDRKQKQIRDLHGQILGGGSQWEQ